MRAVPTLPESMSLPKVPGKCRWCAQPILKENGDPNLRRLWHPQCFSGYQLLIFPRELRKAVRKRDKKKCSVCGKICNSTDQPWVADHIVPVFMSQGRNAFFHLTNVQTLCVPHHDTKTKIDMANYRKMKRGEPVVVIQGQVSSLILLGSHFKIVYSSAADSHKKALSEDLEKFAPFLKNDA